MRKAVLLLSVLIFFLPVSFRTAAVHAADAVNPADSEKIIFFPFADYTGSGMKYLSGYIPEVLKKNFRSERNILPVDFSDVRVGVKSVSLNGDGVPGRGEFLSVMKELGAGMGVTGRYLIQGNTIIIETVLLKPDGSYIESAPFEGKIDDAFFKTLAGYSADMTRWIRGDILHENIHAEIAEEHDITYRFVKIMKDAGLSSMKKGWMLAIVIAGLFYLLSLTVSNLLIKIAVGLSSKTDTNIDDLIFSIARKPLKFIITVAGFKVALFALDMKSAFIVFAGKILTALILMSLAYIASGVLGIFIRAWGDRIAERINPRINNDLVPLFERTVKVVVFSIVIMVILSSFDIDVAPLVASLGIAGFAIGFAVKDTLSNIIGGIILMLDNSFSVGDKVTIDSDTGVIKEVGLRNTKILTYDNELIIIPNGELMNKKFKNYVLPDPTLRVLVNFGVSYGSDVGRVRELVLAAVGSMEGICSEPAPVVEFTQMADFALNFVAKLWIPDFSKYNDKMLEATEIIYKTLNENGIEIPFPTNTVYLRREG